MADRRGQRIRRVGSHRSIQLENASHHELNLRLFGVARSDHSLLDLTRGVFKDIHLGIGSAANRRAARLAQFQGAVGIAIDEYSLDGDFLRPILRDDGLHAAEDFAQPSREFGLAGSNHSASHVGQARAAGIQYAEAGALRPRIDAEHANSRHFKRAQFESSFESA